jgi:hypothetical protein
LPGAPSPSGAEAGVFGRLAPQRTQAEDDERRDRRHEQRRDHVAGDQQVSRDTIQAEPSPYPMLETAAA